MAVKKPEENAKTINPAVTGTQMRWTEVKKCPAITIKHAANRMT